MGEILQGPSGMQWQGVQQQSAGTGAKGSGTVAIRNYDKWQELCINMDTICENKPVDLTSEIFGRTFKYPIFAATDWRHGAFIMETSMMIWNIMISWCLPARTRDCPHLPETEPIRR